MSKRNMDAQYVSQIIEGVDLNVVTSEAINAYNAAEDTRAASMERAAGAVRESMLGKSDTEISDYEFALIAVGMNMGQAQVKSRLDEMIGQLIEPAKNKEFENVLAGFIAIVGHMLEHDEDETLNIDRLRTALAIALNEE